MRRLATNLLLLLTLLLGAVETAAQTGPLEVGDPPIASLISISPADEDGFVNVSGAAGAIFPGAQVAIRNLYTEETVYTDAGITGSFSAEIFGPGNTPFWISPAPSIPTELREQPGSVPGGPGTIIYGSFPEIIPVSEFPVTQLTVDGALEDWESYSQAASGRSLFRLRNQESLYLATIDFPAEYDQMRLVVNSGETIYTLTLDPRVNTSAVWLLEDPVATRELGLLAVASAVDTAVELRIPLQPFDDQPSFDAEQLTLNRIEYLDEESNVLDTVDLLGVAPVFVDEINGIVYPERVVDPTSETLTRFVIGGPVAGGASRWLARSRTNTLSLQPGDTIQLEMDVMLQAPGVAETLSGIQMIGRVKLQSVVGPDGQQGPGGLHTNNGWSQSMTPSGLAIDNLNADVYLGEAVVPAPQVVRRGDSLLFGLSFSLPVPDDLPPGMYVPTFEGFGQLGDGTEFRWDENGVLGEGPGRSRRPITRMPIVYRIGTEEPGRLLWSLFYDYPSNGSRGQLAEQDRAVAALSNRVRHNSPTYILPPTDPTGTLQAYPLEPYLIAMMPNAYQSVSAPLLPLLFPNGRLNLQITLPDGTTENFGGTAVLQNQLSTVALDERLRFGEQSPIDVYRLSTLNPMIAEHQFTAYGNYTIDLTGFVEDVWGNRYEGGGIYEVLIAEPLDTYPAVLPGTPLQIGDQFNPGVRVSPGVPASVSVRLRLYDLNGDLAVDELFEGEANPYGLFSPELGHMRLDQAGEYVIDYELRYEDDEGRLWAASQRSAGVVANPESALIAHGQRGMANDRNTYRPAWYSVEQYSSLPSEDAQLNAPYHSGDLAWFVDARHSGVMPVIRLQDMVGTYANWLRTTFPDFAGSGGVLIDRMGATDALPVLAPENKAYVYINYVRPGLSLREFVLGDEPFDVPLLLDADDPLNGQIGAGFSGLLPGDYVFLFGGAVLRNDEIDLQDAVGYASLGIVIAEDDERGARVFPPFQGAAGGPDGGPLLAFTEEPIDMFFYPAGIGPGDVLQVGDTLKLSGQVAPPLDADIAVAVTSPSGQVYQTEGVANTLGYFYDPETDLIVDEPGVWTVDINIQHTRRISSGRVQPPLPVGGIAGEPAGRFLVYVVPEGAERLVIEGETRTDFAIPPGFPFNFTFTPPPEWTEVQGYITVATPNYLIEEGPVTLTGTSLGYQYNPTDLNTDNPWYEGNNNRQAGPSSSDPLRLTFVLTGTDEAGQFQIRARHVTIRHDRLITLD